MSDASPSALMPIVALATSPADPSHDDRAKDLLGVARLDQQDDEALCRLAQAGDAMAFEELVRRYQPRVMRFALRHLRNRSHDAEEVVQESFLRAYQHLARYEPGRRFASWLLTIAYRACVDRGRRAAIRIARELPADVAAPAVELAPEPGPTWAIARRELPDEQFAGLWMAYAEAMRPAEIAAALGKSAIATKVMLHRARQKLKRALEAEETMR